MVALLQSDCSRATLLQSPTPRNGGDTPRTGLRSPPSTWDDGRREHDAHGPRPLAARRPSAAAVTVPGSKSVTNRALLLAALSGGPATVAGAPPTRDTALMVDALRALGVPVEVDGEHVAVGAHDGLRGGGDGRLRAGRHRHALRPARRGAGRRPRRASTATRAPGSARWARCSTRCGRSAPGSTATGSRSPLHGTGALPGGEVVIDASASSQFVSGLLLSGARYEKGVTVRHDGKPVPSLPHIDMTVAMLRTAGVEVDDADVEHLARRARARSPPATGRWNRTCRTPRCSSPPRRSPAARSRSPAGPSAPPSPASAILPVLEQFGATVVPASNGTGRPRTGHPDRRGRRPARRRRADPDGRRRRRAGRHPVAAARCRPPARTRDRPARRARHRAHRPGRRRRGDRRRARHPARPAARGRPRRGGPTPTTGWPRRARSSGWSSPASRSTTSAAPTRPSPTSPAAGPPSWRADLSAREYDESDVRVRPGARLAAPQQAPPGPRRRRAGDGHHRRPRPLDLRARRRRDPRAGHRDAGPRAGPHARRRRRPGRAGRRPVRRSPTRSPASCGSRSAAPCCAAPPTTRTPSSGSWWPTPSSS